MYLNKIHAIRKIRYIHLAIYKSIKDMSVEHSISQEGRKTWIRRIRRKSEYIKKNEEYINESTSQAAWETWITRIRRKNEYINESISQARWETWITRIRWKDEYIIRYNTTLIYSTTMIIIIIITIVITIITMIIIMIMIMITIMIIIINYYHLLL